MKSSILVLSLSLTALFVANCSSKDSPAVTQDSDLKSQASIISFVEQNKPNDFPKGTLTAAWSEKQSAFVVSSNESGCKVLVKNEGQPKIDSEVACSY